MRKTSRACERDCEVHALFGHASRRFTAALTTPQGNISNRHCIPIDSCVLKTWKKDPATGARRVGLERRLLAVRSSTAGTFSRAISTLSLLDV